MNVICYCKFYETECEKCLTLSSNNLLITQVLPPNELFITLMTSDVTSLLKFVECIWNKINSALSN